MKAYFIKIIYAVLISTLTEMLLPAKWDKYIKTVTGLMIVSAVLSPFGGDLTADLVFPEDDIPVIEERAEEYKNALAAEELRERIEKDIEERLGNEFSLDSKVSVGIETAEDGKISGIKRIDINAPNVPKGVLERIYEIYAPEEVIIN